MATNRNISYKNAPDTVIPTFQVKHRETGDVLTVDPRTFDPDVHEKLEAAPKSKAGGGKKKDEKDEK